MTRRILLIVIFTFFVLIAQDTITPDSLSAATSDSVAVITDEDTLEITEGQTDSLSIAERIARERIESIQELQVSIDEADTAEKVNPLTIEDALYQLIQNNTDIQRARIEWQVGVRRHRASYGVFEPYFTTDYEVSSSDRYDATQSELRESMAVGFEGILPSATQYQFSFTQKDIRYAQNSLDVPNVSSMFTIRQPILRDLIGNGPLSEIRIARTEEDILYNRYRTALIDKCYELENLYWQLVYIQKRRRNSERSVEAAQQIVRDSRTLALSGMISQLDAIEASSQLAERQTQLSNIVLEHEAAMNQLLLMLGVSADSSTSGVTAVTPLQTDMDEDLALSIEEIDSVIINEQPEYISQELEIHRSSQVVKRQRGSVLPELNLIGSWGTSGSSQTFKTAVERYRSDDLDDHYWRYGIELRIPLGAGIRERNMLDIERLNLQLAELEGENLREKLTSQAVLTGEKIGDLKASLENAGVVVEYRTSLLESEFMRLRAGLSTIQKIFELEEALADARQSELEMVATYRMTIALQERLLGTTLEKIEVLIEELATE